MDNGDAFRHTYWNALMVKYVGVDDAKTFADAHESGDDSQGVDKEMDLIELAEFAGFEVQQVSA